MKTNKFTSELKSMGVKSKDFQRLSHSFEIIEIVAFENHTDAREIIAAYRLSEME